MADDAGIVEPLADEAPARSALDPDGSLRELAGDCVHCGFCLPACPTYQLWGEEMDSPRGRIHLITQILDSGQGSDGRGRAFRPVPRLHGLRDGLPVRRAVRPADRGRQDLGRGCRASARVRNRRADPGAAAAPVAPGPGGPGGHIRHVPVPEPAPRGCSGRSGPPSGPGWTGWPRGASCSPGSRRRPLLLWRLRPLRLVSASRVRQGRCWRAEAFPAPDRQKPCPPGADPGPGRAPGRRRHAHRLRAAGPLPAGQRRDGQSAGGRGLRRHRAAGQGCCGALSLHGGPPGRGRGLRPADDRDVRAGGRGRGHRERRGLRLGHEGVRAPAGGRSRLGRTGPRRSAPRSAISASSWPSSGRWRRDRSSRLTVAYHDACHLAHAQRITAQPRALLRGVPGLVLAEIADGGTCCGSAGHLQPGAAGGGRRARRAARPAPCRRPVPTLLVSANPGCSLQISQALAAAGQPMPVAHIAEVLDASIQARTPQSLLQGR